MLLLINVNKKINKIVIKKLVNKVNVNFYWVLEIG